MPTRTFLERAAAAYAAKDNPKLLKIVHEAKGAGGNAGLDRLHDAASALVTLLRSPSFTREGLASGYEGFAQAYFAARAGVKAALGLEPAMP